MIGDFNINCLKYHENAKTKHFYDNTFEKATIPIINRPTRISEHSASLIDNILTTGIFNNSLKKDIIKLDLSNHFQMLFSIQLTKERLQEDVIKIQKEFLITVTFFQGTAVCTSLEIYWLSWNCEWNLWHVCENINWHLWC